VFDRRDDDDVDDDDQARKRGIDTESTLYQHSYANQHSSVLQLSHRHGLCCSLDPRWACVKMVRSPYDRIVSSYLRTAGRTTGFEEMRDGGSFDDFVAAIAQRGRLPAATQRRKADVRKADHVLPQARSACDGRVPGLILVPTECAAEAFEQLPAPAEHLRGLVNVSRLAPPVHYHRQADPNPTPLDADNLTALAYSNFADGAHPVPAYGRFTASQRVRDAVATYFAEDLALYRRTCGQPWLAGVASCMAACEKVLCSYNER